jgi:hypothetical protein
VHGKQGYIVLALAFALTFIDLYDIVRRVLAYFRGGENFSLASFWSSAILGRDQVLSSSAAEYTSLINEESKDMQETEMRKRVHYDPDEEDEIFHATTTQRAENVHRHQYSQSRVSDGTVFSSRSMHSNNTLHDVDYMRSKPKKTLLKRIGAAIFAVCERTLVIAGFVQVLTGIIVYTGGCRENYMMGCLAHLSSTSHQSWRVFLSL